MSRGGVKQAKRFHEPLAEGETAQKTIGCRHTNPDICAKHSLSTVCAFVRADGMCLAPPASWSKQYERLLQLRKSPTGRQ